MQAAEQLNGTEWVLMKAYEPGVLEVQSWLAARFPNGADAKVGVDPSVFDAAKAQAWKEEWAAATAGGSGVYNNK